MKKIIFILLVSFISFGIVAKTKNFWRGEFLPTEKVCDKWGKMAFDGEKFKSASESDRAKMACDLIKNQKKFLNKDRAEIRKLLGDYDGFYFSDMFPSYMIETAKADGQDSWQIVFLLNKKEAVKDIVVHKNCCDN